MEKYQKYFHEREYLAALCDAKLITNDGLSFDVHRITLARKSKFFRNLFSYFANDKEPTVIPFKGEAINEVLYFIYTNLVDINKENFLEILLVADFLQIDELYNLTKNYAVSKLSAENCMKIYNTSKKINEQHLVQLSFRVIQMNFERLTDETDFLEMPVDYLIEILKDNSLLVSGENVIWESIMKWVNRDTPNRLKEIWSLIKCLKVDDIDESLAKEIIESDIVYENSYCSELVSMPSKRFQCSSFKDIIKSCLEFSERDFSEACQRLPNCMHLIICSDLQERNSKNPSIYVTYDEKLDFWRKLGEFEYSESPFRLSVSYVVHIITKKIYAFDFLRRIGMIFNLCEKNWQVMENFHQDIEFKCSVVVGNNIYFISIAEFGDRQRREMIKYNTESGLWSDAMPMDRFSDFEAVSLRNKIFAVGQEQRELRLLAQVYEEKSNSWSFITQPSIFRRSFRLTAYHNKLYIIGGSDSDNLLRDNFIISSVEVFDPVKNEWEIKDNLPVSNVYHVFHTRSLIVNDQLFFISRKNHTSIDQFVLNEKNENWVKPERNLPVKYFNFRFKESLKFHTIYDKRIMNILAKQNRESQAIVQKSFFP